MTGYISPALAITEARSGEEILAAVRRQLELYSVLSSPTLKQRLQDIDASILSQSEIDDVDLQAERCLHKVRDLVRDLVGVMGALEEQLAATSKPTDLH